ncbi:MAG: imidazolonepropionase [Phycisphaerae bacterium]|nr:imidazolonepropionase [Phycisphaerae bacterium]NUQ46028.1 imidazolonepropionase [Phycisphaerae bacterium]
MNLVIRNIGQLLVVPPGPVSGETMRTVPRIEGASLVARDGRIAWFGPADDAPTIDGETTVLDARGGCVLPGLIDCHTHAVFAGTREREWVWKIEGKSYLEILEAGGGIHTTVAAVRAATLDELVAAARPRLSRMLANGVTTAEIKSGYGLTVDDELKMLRAVRRLSVEQPIELVGTWLAAHAIPAEYRGRPGDYVDAITQDGVLETIRRERLAEFADVFCERGAFDLPQAERYLAACARFGLRAKVHADQLTRMGASALAARLGAVSADHLECIDDAGIDALKSAGTVPVLLPGCSLFLNSRPADARRLIRAGLPVAVATDVNPGSCLIESLPLVMSLACTLLRMTPVEAAVACTANAAAAIDRADRLGAMAEGFAADLIVLDVPCIERMCYEVGRPCVRVIVKAGQVVHERVD